MARIKEFDEEEVLDKAVNLFWSKGYNGTSAQDLVEGLGISRSSLYDTFGDKRNLFIKALQQYRHKETANMINLIDHSSDMSETIQQILQTAISVALKDKLCKGCFMVNSTIEMAPHDKEIAQIVQSNMQDFENALVRAITKGQESGQFTRKYSSLTIARFLFNTISGIQVAAKCNADKKLYDDIIILTLSLLK